MHSTYTPGPWHQHTSEGKTYASVRGANGRIVADCGSRSDEAAQANARLIAASPDLLAACVEAVGFVSAWAAHLNDCGKGVSSYNAGKAAHNLRAAITRAGGAA